MAPKVARRPAMEPRRRSILRRPGAGQEGDRGRIPVPEEEPAIGGLIHGMEASYYGNACQFSGKVIEELRDASGRYFMVKLTGMDLEALLTWGSSKTPHAKVHLCLADCSQESEGPGLVHCQRYGGIKPWTSWPISSGATSLSAP